MKPNPYSSLVSPPHRLILLAMVCCFFVTPCQADSPLAEFIAETKPAPVPAGAIEVNDLLPVDCLLPGQIRRLGNTVYQSPRRPTKTTARSCAIRGGEYVVQDQADYTSALRIWLPQAQTGDAEAQVYVGDIYQMGLGSAPQYDRAAEWYKKAAEQGNKRAQMSLGYLYENGLGVPRDAQQAHDWYRKASGLKEFVALEQAGPSPLQLEELQSLRKEVQQSKDEIEKLKRQLEETSRKLDGARNQLKQRQSKLDAEKQVLAEERQNLEQKKQQASDDSRERLQDLDRQLSNREAELAKQRTEIDQLKSEIDAKTSAEQQYRQTLENLQTKLENLPAPFIEINDPLILATRGVKLAWVEPQQKSRKVVGKVWAPAGLASFRVNDKPESPSADGSFSVPVQLHPSNNTEVRMVALDSRGQSSSVEFTLKPQESKQRPDQPKTGFTDIDFGNYHALIIGNIDYQHLPALKTAVNDAEEIGKVLKEQYGFQVTVLRNASRLETFRALEKYLRSLNEKDNFLLYYAGHGELDAKNSRGYWLPVDAEPNSRGNWIPNVEITDYLNLMAAKQILVIADACYAGIMTRSTINPMQPGMSAEVRRNFLKRLAGERARMVLSSGEDQPVLDAGGGDHSVFANVVLDVLRSNDEVIEGFRLYQRVNETVLYRSEAYGLSQVPQYAALITAGHKSGDFILVPRK